MKKQILVWLTFLLPFLGYAQEEAVDPKAKSILDKTIASFDSKKSLLADFMIKVENAKNGKEESYPGKIYLKGEKFKLQLQDVTTFFDGKTQSVYMTKEGEVTISNPDKEELKEINPILLMKSCASDYKMRYLGLVKVEGKAMEKIELYPNDLKCKYSIVTLLIEKDNNMLNTISLRGKNGITTQFYITKTEVLKTLGDETFVFDTKKYPKVEVVDLR